MTRPSPVNSRMVLRALYDLAARQDNVGISAGDMAAYLKAEEAEVLKELLGLRAQRLVVDRRRRGERVWLPWRLA